MVGGAGGTGDLCNTWGDPRRTLDQLRARERAQEEEILREATGHSHNAVHVPGSPPEQEMLLPQNKKTSGSNELFNSFLDELSQKFDDLPGSLLENFSSRMTESMYNLIHAEVVPVLFNKIMAHSNNSEKGPPPPERE
ncbi:hypothetical protein VP01_1004g15 [Puccinia sorghi]|uniref:Uncharacterized protein n=1 Tax=Puccinia sorghi TaxID=27349 RepID=A0A0L6VVQ0_9BASI|nr:hypothetical protein VP01_1004g15 [Puccinia sorghi]